MVVFLSALLSRSFVFSEEQVPATIDSKISEANPQTVAFFENKIRPLLAEHCYECHGEDEQESDLRVDSLAGLLRGGEGYGAAITPGDPSGSILISAVKHQELTMPPEKNYLSVKLMIWSIGLKSARLGRGLLNSPKM